MKMIITEEKSNDMINKLHNIVSTIKDVIKTVENCEEDDRDFKENKYRDEYKYQRNRDYDYEEEDKEFRRRGYSSRY